MTRHLAPARQPTTGIGRAATTLSAALLALVVLAVLIVGPPWALLHYVGSPIPHTLPDRHQLATLLTQPLSDDRLIHLLAGLCWIAWAIFVLDTARSLTAPTSMARADDLPSWQPIRRLAALLVGTIALTLVGQRGASTATALAAAQPTHTPHQPAAAAAAHATRPAEPGTVTVQEPHDGIHDSLWRIAQRTLGDGNRWPEIYQLNQNRPQPDGDRLTDPFLIQPGWILRLPPQATPTHRPAPPAPRPAQPHLPRQSHTPAPSRPTQPRETPSTPVPTIPNPAGHSEHAQPDGIDLGDGIYLSTALAAAVSAALLARRRRNRREYVPGSGRRDDLPIAPVVRKLNLAHLHSLDPEPSGVDHPDEVPPGTTSGRELTLGPAPAEASPSEGDSLPVNTAPFHAGGLGLVGPGAADAARGILLDALTRPGQQIITTRAMTAALFDPLAAPSDRIRICDNFDQALTELEDRFQPAATSSSTQATTVLLIADVPRDSQRLQAVLDSGAPYGIGAVLLGQWRPGATTYVLDNGTVSATSAGPIHQLRGSRLFTAPAAQTAAVLDLLVNIQSAPTAPPANQHADLELPTSTSRTPPANSEVQPARPPLTLRILGSTRLTWMPDGANAVDLTPTVGPRQREVLVLLALNPDGLTRDRVVDTIWPDTPRERPSSPLHSTLARLRSAISEATNGQITTIATVHGDRYQLDPTLVDVDYWHVDDAIAARSASDNAERSAALATIVERYGGELAADLPVDWIETARESIRRTALDAATTLARKHIDDDPQRALDMLEAARTVDPYNEALYQEVMRVQHLLHRDDAVVRTLDLLANRLSEIDERPSPDTVALARQLARPTASH